MNDDFDPSIINEVYFEKETIDQLRDYFHQEDDFRSVTLGNFFSDNGIELILKELENITFQRDYKEMSHRRYYSDLPNFVTHLLRSNEFKNILSEITGYNFPDLSGSVYRYGHREYQIINDEMILPPGYDIIIDLTPQWVDDLGGIVMYTDGEGQFFTLPSNFGAISVIQRPAQYHYFVKYVNHYVENLQRVLVISNTVVET